MIVREKTFIVVLFALLIYTEDNLGRAFQPEFITPIANVTVAIGRDAVFTCLVEHLGGYRVGWVKADTKAIQAIHDHVITHNPRVYVSHGDHSTWSLHIKGVQLEDAGVYMCQINTDPMKSQTGVLTVLVPPDFLSGETSSDVMVREGGQVTLTCHAKGVPQPTVSWRREDGKDIILRQVHLGKTVQKPNKIVVSEYKGEELKLTNVFRHEMGAYFCIASNGVPPAISKRIIVNIHFPPIIHVPNQLVGAPLGTDVDLECFVEASPKAINYWVKETGSMIISNTRHDVQTTIKSPFEVRMKLTIRNLQRQDVGSYRCAAKNSLGEMESNIRLYEISGPSRTQTVLLPSLPDEKQDEEDVNVIIVGANNIEKKENKPVDNTVHGHIGYPTASIIPPTTKLNKKHLSNPKISLSRGIKLHSSTNILKMLLIVLANFKWQQ